MDVTKLINNEEISFWYTVPDSEVEVLIKSVPPKKMTMLSDLCMKFVSVGRSHEKELDNKKYNKMLLDEAVLDWRNIEMDGKPFPCTRDNKIKLDGCWLSFRLFWNQVVVEAQSMESLKVEEDLKN